MKKQFLSLVLMFFFLASFCFASGNKESNESNQASFPESGKQIKMIITHGVGGSVDVAARGIAPYLEKYLGTTIVTENMTGSGGRRAMDYVFKADPDGYTIVVSAFPSRIIGELLYDTNYKMKEFVHLGAWLGGDYRSVVIASNSEIKTFNDLLEKSKKGELTAAGGGGMGSSSQLQTVFLKNKVGLNVNFIPFESTAEVTNAVMGGHVDFGIMPLSAGLRFQNQGGIKVLAVHSPKRLKIAPDVASLEELGFKGVVIPNRWGALAPPGTSAEIQAIYAEAIKKSVEDPEFLAWVKKTNNLLDPLGPEEFYKSTLEDIENISSVLDIIKQGN